MMKIGRHDPPRPWVVGVTCLFAFIVFMTVLIVMDAYGLLCKTDPPEVWDATIVSAVLLFGGIFLAFYMNFRQMKRKAREQEGKDDTHEK